MKFSEKSLKKGKSKKSLPLVYCICFLLAGIWVGHKDILRTIKANIVLLNLPGALSAVFHENDLPTMELQIGQKNFQIIENKRREAIKRGRLISGNQDFVDAKLKFNDKSLNCKVRLKGDLPDHWSNDKLSLRVKLKESNFKGLNYFSLQRHGTRQDTGQWLFLKSLQEEGLLAVNYHFINFKINGKKLGIYALEGHFADDLAETNQKREGVIISFDEYRYWNDNGSLEDSQRGIRLLEQSEILIRNQGSVKKSPFLLKQSVIAKNLLRRFINNELEAHEVFDHVYMGKFLALTKIWNAEHSLHIHNVNFYLNPITCKLEPIGFDGMPGHSESPSFSYFTNETPQLLWVRKALESEVVANSYLKYLSEFTERNYFEKLKQKFHQEESHYRKLIIKNLFLEDHSTIWSSFFTLLTNDIWTIFEKRLENIRKKTSEDRPLVAHVSLDDGKYCLFLCNAHNLPVDVIGIKFDDSKLYTINHISRNFSKRSIRLKPQLYDRNRKKYEVIIPIDLDFAVKLKMGEMGQLDIISQIPGSGEKIKSTIKIEHFEFQNKSILYEKFSKRMEDFEFVQKQGNILKMYPGNHLIDSSVYIDEGLVLEIPKGTTIKFASNALLVSKSPIIAKGTENFPIKFLPEKKTWPGIVIISSISENSFEHVVFSGTSGVGRIANFDGLYRGGWNLTGGVTIYKSKTKIFNCLFEHSFTEDALNLISSRFSMNSCKFSNLYSDGFDGDFVNGNVVNCFFSKIKGDGLDFSGSDVEVKQCLFQQISDKAISIGEDSNVSIFDSTASDVSYGVVSKDNSITRVNSSKIINAKKSAFAAYQKKHSFGPSRMLVNKSMVIDCTEAYLAQKGSPIIVENIEVKGIELDVKELYLE